MIPRSPREDTDSRAEVRLFECLRDDTSDDLVAFHSVAWPADWLSNFAQSRRLSEA